MDNAGVPAQLHRLLEACNLLAYKSALLEQGADDVEQLVTLDAEEFQQLCSMIGMEKKPFHVMRLRKALDKHSPLSNPPTVTNASISTHTSNTTGSDISTEPLLTYPLPSISPSPVAFSDHSQQATLSSSVSNSPSTQPQPQDPSLGYSLPQSSAFSHRQLAQGGSVKLFLPPYLHPDCDATDFKELIDDQTPVQKSLDGPPCKPGMWDSKRQDIIRKYAAIYGRNVEKRQKELVTPFEEHVNEASYQLCLRDPTLLVRREELFILSKRAVKEGGYAYYHGTSKDARAMLSTPPVIGQKRKREQNKVSLPEMTVIGTELAGRLTTAERVSRMKSLKTLIETNKSQQAIKIAAMEEARCNNDFSTSFNLQLEVESLGTACQELVKSYALLKRKQARSERYFRDKVKYTPQDMPADKTPGEYSGSSDTGSQHDELLSPILPITLPPPLPTSRSNSLSNPSNDHLLHSGTPPNTSPVGAQNQRVSKRIRKNTPKKVTVTVVKDEVKSEGGDSKNGASSENEIQDLVNNVSNATDQVNSLINGDFNKDLNWEFD